MRKGEIACNKQFLIFSQCFPELYIFSASKCGIVHFKMSSAICFKLDQSKILLSGNGLKGPGNSQYIFNTVVPLFSNSVVLFLRVSQSLLFCLLLIKWKHLLFCQQLTLGPTVQEQIVKFTINFIL